jgi:uncharacterized protein (TIGR02271 family)
MITAEQVPRLLQARTTILGRDGEKIGTVGQVYLDEQTGTPEWVTAKTGLFGMSESFVPLKEADVVGEEIRVPYDKDQVKDAPRMDNPEDRLSEDEEARLYQYYGLPYSMDDSATGLPSGTGTTGAAGTRRDYRDDTMDTGRYRDDTDRAGTARRDTTRPMTDDAMTRSEERLHVGKEQRETGRARLRKYVTTENVTQTVPVSREEVRVEREPITDANRDAAMEGQDITESEHEVTLHAEKPVVDKETVPVERVRLDKDTVTDEASVSDEVRKEKIELDDDGNETRRR